MRDYGKISTTIWRSNKFQSLVCHTDQLFYFYLHTCPHINSVGCFVLPMGYAEEDLGWERSAIERAIEALSKALLIAYHKPSKTLRIIDFLAHDPISNANHAKGAVKIALGLPDSPEKLNVLKELSQSRFVDSATLAEKIEALSIGVSKGYRTPEPEPEPEPQNILSDFEETPELDLTSDPPPDDLRIRFEKFWLDFPGDLGSKGSKAEALNKFLKLKPDDILLATMRRALIAQARHKRVCRSQGEFAESFPHVVRWLSKRRWEDELPTEQTLYHAQEIID